MRYAVISILITNILFSTSLNWSNNYHLARQQAKKENKKVFLFVSAYDNPFAQYMQIDVFQDEKVVKAINKHYIPVLLYTQDNNFPAGLTFYSAPAIYFLDAKGHFFEKRYKKIVGEITKKQILKIFKNIKYL